MGKRIFESVDRTTTKNTFHYYTEKSKSYSTSARSIELRGSKGTTTFNQTVAGSIPAAPTN